MNDDGYEEQNPGNKKSEAKAKAKAKATDVIDVEDGDYGVRDFLQQKVDADYAILSDDLSDNSGIDNDADDDESEDNDAWDLFDVLVKQKKEMPENKTAELAKKKLLKDMKNKDKAAAKAAGKEPEAAAAAASSSSSCKPVATELR